MRNISIFLFLFLFSLSTSFASFSDIDYSWYKTSILNLQRANIINGQPDGSYKPNWSITRAEMLKIIMGAANISLEAAPQDWCFRDVDSRSWYGTYICTARALGITDGFDDGTFRPNETITDLEALAFGFRIFGIVPTPIKGQIWYEVYRDLANVNDILAIHSYTVDTKLSRGKAAELIESIGKYAKSKVALGYKSPGCTALFSTPLGTKNTLLINGASRSYNLSIPTGYSKDKQYNLVVALHGRTNSNDRVQSYMGLQGSAGWGGGGATG